MTVAVLAVIEVPDPVVPDVRVALLRLASWAAREPGTELFAVNEAAEQPGRFVVFERYRDAEAVTAHRSSAAMGDFRLALRSAGAAPVITFLTPLAASGG